MKELISISGILYFVGFLIGAYGFLSLPRKKIGQAPWLMLFLFSLIQVIVNEKLAVVGYAFAALAFLVFFLPSRREYQRWTRTDRTAVELAGVFLIFGAFLVKAFGYPVVAVLSAILLILAAISAFSYVRDNEEAEGPLWVISFAGVFWLLPSLLTHRFGIGDLVPIVVMGCAIFLTVSSETERQEAAEATFEDIYSD